MEALWKQLRAVGSCAFRATSEDCVKYNLWFLYSKTCCSEERPQLGLDLQPIFDFDAFPFGVWVADTTQLNVDAGGQETIAAVLAPGALLSQPECDVSGFEGSTS